MTTYLIEAVNHDPQNVTALAHLAHSYMIQSILGLIEPHAALTASEAVVKRARRINSTHIEVRNASAWLDLLYARDWQHADREFGEILQSESCNWRALAGKALTAFACNRCEEAIPLLERISAENILSSTAYFLHAYVLYASGYISDALSVVYTAKSLGLGIYWHKTIEALCLIQAGDLEQVINQFSADFLNSESTDILRGAIGYAYTASGRQEEVLHEINKFMSPEFTHQPRHDFFAPALIYLGLGKMQKTVECLEQSYRAGSFFSLGFHTLPILQQLRNTPEYMNLSSILLYPSRS
ncbi:MAG: hypothetical protein P4K83_05880 [Terracidiphilus sp.]|nr:hypothetical protein [Terracidiphilus sp.]